MQTLGAGRCEISATPRLLNDLMARMEGGRYAELPRVVLDTQEELDALVAAWMAEQPRPEESEF